LLKQYDSNATAPESDEKVAQCMLGTDPSVFT
jgi:hypothetical protein